MEGLSKAEKEIPFKFIYDEVGSRLITSINKTSVYYIWECEHEIFNRFSSQMLGMMGPEKFNLIDLGAGDASKTQVILRKAKEEGIELEYVPMDISIDSNAALLERLETDFPDLAVTAITSQFEVGVQWVRKNKTEKNVFLFVGATIGNATKEENKQFVSMLSQNMKKGDQIFVGFDMMKSAEVITRAYLDNGFESDLIMNNLSRMNKELGSNFDLEQYDPFPYFDPHNRCIELVIISKKDQKVNLNGQEFEIQEAEVIKTGKSRKWLMK